MSWSYDPATLATSELYQVRFLVGDTNESDPLLQDEEINYLLSINQTVVATAIACCERISATFARLVDHRLGPLSVSNSQKSAHYARLARQLTQDTARYNTPTMSADQHEAIFDKEMMKNNMFGCGGNHGSNN